MSTTSSAHRFDPSSADDLRAEGWSVAVHNDYMLNGEEHTFWLMTKRIHGVVIAAKGEGHTDSEALDDLRKNAAESIRLLKNVVAFNTTLDSPPCPNCGSEESETRYEKTRVRENLTVEVPRKRCLQCAGPYQDPKAEDVMEHAVLEHDRTLLTLYRAAFKTYFDARAALPVNLVGVHDHHEEKELWLNLSEAIDAIEKQAVAPNAVGPVNIDGIQA